MQEKSKFSDRYSIQMASDSVETVFVCQNTSTLIFDGPILKESTCVRLKVQADRW